MAPASAFASRPDALSRCLKVIIRAIETSLLQGVELRRASGARTGIVTLIQRFGSALNLNVHLHMLILDGVYTKTDETVHFHRLTAPTSTQLQALLNRIIARIVVRLEKDALLVAEDPDPAWLNLEPADALDSLNAASVRYRIALGPNAGQRTLTLRNPALERNTPLTTKPQTADRDEFSLNVGQFKEAVFCRSERTTNTQHQDNAPP